MIRDLLIACLEQAAADLEFIRLPHVFVGGGTMPFYVDPSSATRLRETKDVGCKVLAASYGEFADLEDQLRERGFVQPLLDRRAPKCRWRKDGLVFDIVDLRSDFPDQPWTLPTAPGIIQQALPSGRMIPILCPGRFLAAKVAALRDRGRSHWYESTDFEDIVLLLESRSDLDAWLVDTPPIAIQAVSAWAGEALAREDLSDDVQGCVTPGDQAQERADRVLDALVWLARDWPSAG